MANNGKQTRKPKGDGKPRRTRDPSATADGPDATNQSEPSNEPNTTAGDTGAAGTEPSRTTKQRRPPWWSKAAKDKAKVENKTEVSSTAKEHDTAEAFVVTYKGRSKGSTPVARSASHNIDMSQFILLVRECYNVILSIDEKMSESCPFPMFQHYCTTILNAYLLDLARENMKYQALVSEQALLEQIRACDLYIPSVLYEYICSIGNSISTSDQIIMLNYPESVIPHPTFILNEVAHPSGTFGVVDMNNHNKYECYIAPYTTSQYITATIQANVGVFNQNWNPLPVELAPANAEPTENFLGYWPIEQQHPNAVREMNRCLFTNGDNLLGRIRYSRNLMELVNIKMILLKSKFSLDACTFRFRETASIFIVKDPSDEDDLGADQHERITEESVRLKSPYAFGNSAANRACYFGLKRVRRFFKPGTCYLIDGVSPPAWVLSRDRNYTQANPFQPGNQLELFPVLRDHRYYCAHTAGFINDNVRDWMLRTGLK